MENPHQPAAEAQLGFSFEVASSVPERRIWRVSDLAAELRARIERDFSDLWVEGEISDLRPAASGHIYFTLKDDSGQLAAVLFRRQASLLRFHPENGLQVLVRGKASMYEQRGQVQLVVEHVEPMGAGSLQLAFEQVKRRLEQEGLFDPARKKPLPAFPRSVGIVTSPTGAVIRDFLTVTSRRHAALHIVLYPALVQGESAAAEIARGIEYFNQTREVDLIVLARGGGSLEDLAPFNTESLARAIAASELPVVSAVGHETDFTIADFAADLRAPTPSAAAEIITAVQYQVEERLNALAARLDRAARYAVMQASERFARIGAEPALAHIRDNINRRQQQVDELCFRMESIWRAQAQQHSQRLQALATAILRNDAAQRIHLMRERLGNLSSRLLRAQAALQQIRYTRLQSLQRQLAALSPFAVLNRGYALVYNESGALLKSASDTATGQFITTRLAAGTLTSRVTQTHIEKDQ